MRYGIVIALLLFVNVPFFLSAKERKQSVVATMHWSVSEIKKREVRYRAWQAHQPALERLVEKAYTHFKLSFERMPELVHKSRQAAWLPKLSTSYDVNFDQKSAVSIQDNVSVTSGDVTVGPSESQENYNLDQGQGVTAKLEWDLAPLLYRRDEIVMNREQLAISSERLRLAEKVGEVYHKRDVAALKRYFSPLPLDALAAESELRGLGQSLEALTGYVFSEEENFF